MKWRFVNLIYWMTELKKLNCLLYFISVCNLKHTVQFIYSTPDCSDIFGYSKSYNFILVPLTKVPDVRLWGNSDIWTRITFLLLTKKELLFTINFSCSFNIKLLGYILCFLFSFILYFLSLLFLRNWQHFSIKPTLVLLMLFAPTLMPSMTRINQICWMLLNDCPISSILNFMLERYGILFNQKNFGEGNFREFRESLSRQSFQIFNSRKFIQRNLLIFYLSECSWRFL